MEKLLNKLVIIFMILLIITQGLHTVDSIRPILSKSIKLEGKSIQNNNIEYGMIEMATDIPSYLNLFIYINGEKSDKFNKPKTSIKVKDKDIIEIRAIDTNENIKVSITNKSDNIEKPKIGEIINFSRITFYKGE